MPVGKGYARKSKATRYAGGYLLIYRKLGTLSKNCFASQKTLLRRVRIILTWLIKIEF